jgi:hypothetical protein
MDLRFLLTVTSSLIIRGQFVVQSTQERTFETLVGVFGELKVKLDDIDTLKYHVQGKSRITAPWGTKFHARVIKSLSGVLIEVYDIAAATSDQLIKEVYETFTKYEPASSLKIEYVGLFHKQADIDKLLYGEPEITDDTHDDSKMQPVPVKPCTKCGASNPPGSRFCGKCGHRIGSCPVCRYVPEDDSSYCIKCGTKLA